MKKRDLQFNCLQEEKGAALITAIMIVFVLSALGAGLLTLTTSNFQLTGIEQDYQAAYYIAEAGINYLIDQFNQAVYGSESQFENSEDFFDFLEDSDFINETIVLSDFELNQGKQPTASITVKKESNGGNPRAYTIESVGKIGNSTRKVSAGLSVRWGKDDNKVKLSEIDDIFVLCPQFAFTGSNITGNGGTILAGDLTTHDLNGGSAINVTNLFFGGSVTIDGGSASFGNKDYPGKIYVDGTLELWNGTRDVYGEVHVNGNFRLKDARIHGNVYVNGNVELGWTPQIHQNIYYTGTLTAPANYNQDLLNKCIKVDSVEPFSIPKFGMQTKDLSWYLQNGYTVMGDVSMQVIPDNARLFVDNFYSQHHTSPAGEIVIISKNDIEIKGWRRITGVLIAPYGQVRLTGIESFTGVIISKDQVLTSSGGSTIIMRKLSDFFTENTMPIDLYYNEPPSGSDPDDEDDDEKETTVQVIVPIRET